MTKHIHGGRLEDHVDAVRNQDVLAYLERTEPCCHSDNCSVLVNAATAKCGDWFLYCPSIREYRYIALVTNRIVFALGLGMNALYFKVPERLYPMALGTGAAPVPEIGCNWVEIQLFRSDWPAPDIPFWTLKAYDAARQLS
ncbi:MAG: hypothetical protein JWN70_2039 [Planctomycetaceae bacterium]|nr:hypothetical protein [Planctomycetaceae bacterium]